MKYFNDVIKNIQKEDVIEYYNNRNYSQKECADHFEISVGMFIRILKHYNIKKDSGKHSELIKKTKLKKYGNENYNNRELAKSACLEKYGFDNVFKDTIKMKESYIDKLGVDHPMRREDIANKAICKRDYSSIIKKRHETYFNKTGYSNPSKNPECIKKNLQTRIEHGVFNSNGTSNIEKRCKKILDRKFKNVVEHYRDERYGRCSGYMFECDFYIPSGDLFIELNGHPSHYKHPFDGNNPKDVEFAEILSKSEKIWDKRMLETWAKRDVEKIECAKNNSLNYIVIYPYTSLHENLSFNDKKYSNIIKYIFKKFVAKK